MDPGTDVQYVGTLPINYWHILQPLTNVLSLLTCLLFEISGAVIDYGNGFSACRDAIIYGYDLMFEREGLFDKTSWLGVPQQQDPNDAMMIQELLFAHNVDVVIELGTNGGGGALFFASVMSLYNPAAKVITIDPKHYSKVAFHRNPCGKWEPEHTIIY